MKPAASAARSNPRAGFTLLETLAALAIAAAAFAVIVDFSMRTLRNWHRGDQAIAAMEMITRGIGRLQTDLAVSLPMSVPGGDGAAVLFKGDANGLVFAAATGFGTGNRGVELISVSAFQDREDIALIRNRGPVGYPQPELRDPVVLMRGRMRVRFSYRDHNGKTVPTWIEQPELPTVVAIEIFGAQGNPILPVPALIALPQNYSVECFNPPSDKANIQVRCAQGNQENNDQEPDPDAASEPRQRRR
ncbi:MAG TPA: prepilin-type N-terminal cleavage/methylation domain-containing protein [Xanthobacteraceae bacterium]|nr:prepilin-type N-terminal cleavage/methylation domain-containing protein [Xanthobacteraceae bacterium]